MRGGDATLGAAIASQQIRNVALGVARVLSSAVGYQSPPVRVFVDEDTWQLVPLQEEDVFPIRQKALAACTLTDLQRHAAEVGKQQRGDMATFIPHRQQPLERVTHARERRPASRES